MKPSIFVFTIILFLLSMTARGQSPGFMGKHFFVEGHVGPNILLSRRTPVNFTDDDYLSMATIIPRLSLNYVVSRHKYLALEAGSRFFYEDIAVEANLEEANLRFRTQVTGYALALYYTNSNRNYVGSLAPVGRFIGYKISYHQLASQPVKYTESRATLNSNDMEKYKQSYQNPAGNFLGLGLTYGARTVLKDRITVTACLDFGFIGVLDPSYYSGSLRRPLRSEQLSHYLKFYTNITLGAGVLLF